MLVSASLCVRCLARLRVRQTAAGSPPWHVCHSPVSRRDPPLHLRRRHWTCGRTCAAARRGWWSGTGSAASCGWWLEASQGLAPLLRLHRHSSVQALYAGCVAPGGAARRACGWPAAPVLVCLGRRTVTRVASRRASRPSERKGRSRKACRSSCMGMPPHCTRRLHTAVATVLPGEQIHAPSAAADACDGDVTWHS